MMQLQQKIKECQRQTASEKTSSLDPHCTREKKTDIELTVLVVEPKIEK